MKGIELAARFSFITNALRFCGPEEASGQFLNYFQKKDNEKQLEDSIRKFEGLYPYLGTIAEKTGKSPFDYSVVEAYWIGNSLLEKFERKDMEIIIRKLMTRGLMESTGERLIKDMPEGMFPHHNFNVMYVGVGNTSGKVETNLNNMDNCRISIGRVVEVLDDKLLVATKPLKFGNNKYYIGNEEIKTAVYNNITLEGVKKGNIVALHWGYACISLDEKQANSLENYSMRIINIINQSLKDS